MDAQQKEPGSWQQWAHRLAERQWAYPLILLVGMLMFLPNLGQHGLWDIDEAHNAECAREMREANEWIVPTFNYQLRTDKPVLLYWCIQVCYLCFGISEWSARLPSVLAGLCSLLVCYEIARRLFGRVTGLLSGLILGSSLMFAVSSHAVTPDALLILTVQLTFLTWNIAYDSKQPAWLLLTGLCGGLAMLAKGPVGVALPAAATTLLLLWQRDLSFLWQRRTLQAIFFFCLIALPWYILVGYETRMEFIKGFFLTHHFSRFSAPMEGHIGPFYYHLLVILVAFAPWSIFLGPTIWYSIRRGSLLEGTSKPWAYRLLLLWVAMWFIVFSLAATKLPNYVLPTYPPLAMLTAAFLVRWWKQSQTSEAWHLPGWVWRCSAICFVAIGVLLLMAMPFITGWIPFSVLDGRTLPEAVWLLPLALVPIIAGWLTWKRWSQNHIGWGVTTVLLGSIVLTATLGAWGPVAADHERASKPLAEMMREAIGNSDVRIATHPKFYRPSMVFYVKHEITRCTTQEQAMEMLQTQIPTYMLVPATSWPEMAQQLAGQYTVLGQKHDFTAGQEILLISNQPAVKTSKQPDPQ